MIVLDKQFLDFFFKQIRVNDTGRYTEDFAFLSPCGRERNFVRCDDLPVVFTQLTSDDQLVVCGTQSLRVPFEPEKICMLPESGRVYHPGPAKVGGVGLIKSSLAVDFSKYFEFEDNSLAPHAFTWKGQRYELTNELVPVLQQFKAQLKLD